MSRRFGPTLPDALPAAALLALVLGAGCGSSAAGPSTDLDGPVDVLFVGNSLTYTNALPDVVTAMARAAGDDPEIGSVTRPNSAIMDHWAEGLPDRIREARARVVVLQQGPSSLDASRENLVEWTERAAPVIREAGGEPALFMVWPGRARAHAHDAVRTSYRAAADAVDGIFIPAGDALRYLESLDPDANPYGSDGFHPSRLGTYTAALTIHAVLWRTEAELLEPVLRAAADGMGFSLSAERAGTVVQAVLLALEDAGI